MITTAVLATVAFAATNIDGAFILLALFSLSTVKDAQVVAGTYLGMAVLVIAALTLSAVCQVLLPNDLGLLGALPILVGLRQFWTARSEGGGDIIGVSPDAGAFEVIELVAIRTVANGADNIAVYIPLFARQSRAAEILTCVVFAVLVGAWCLGAKWMAGHSTIVAPLRRWGRWITPIVLISLGIFVFFRVSALSS
jgi:cadmium resistance protein CadD (predicted permease)